MNKLYQIIFIPHTPLSALSTVAWMICQDRMQVMLTQCRDNFIFQRTSNGECSTQSREVMWPTGGDATTKQPSSASMRVGTAGWQTSSRKAKAKRNSSSTFCFTQPIITGRPAVRSILTSKKLLRSAGQSDRVTRQEVSSATASLRI